MTAQALKSETRSFSDFEPKLALKRLSGIMADMLSWTVRSADAQRAGKNTQPYSLVADDIQLLRIDYIPVLKRIAELGLQNALKDKPPVDYCAAGVKRVGYRLWNDNNLIYMVPGQDIPFDAQIVRVIYNPDAYYLPFSNLLDALRYFAHRINLKLADVVFTYDDEPVFNIVKFSEMHRVCPNHTLIDMIGLIETWHDDILEGLD